MTIDINAMIQKVVSKYFWGRSFRENQNVKINQEFNQCLWHEFAPRCLEEYGGVVPYTTLAHFDYIHKRLNIFCTELVSAYQLGYFPMRRYKNRCEQCVFLGCYHQYDLYTCEQERLGKTLIARYGDDGEYHSYLELEFLRDSRTEEGYQYVFTTKQGRALYVASDCDTKGLRVNIK